jgi:hypothetical protein
MPKQKQVKPKLEENSADNQKLSKLLEKEVKAPQIEDVLAEVGKVLKQAQKQVRTHHCRVCGEHTCIHYERVYDDNGEEVDMIVDPDTGERYEELS